jgi:hypothetical protein
LQLAAKLGAPEPKSNNANWKVIAFWLSFAPKRKGLMNSKEDIRNPKLAWQRQKNCSRDSRTEMAVRVEYWQIGQRSPPAPLTTLPEISQA